MRPQLRLVLALVTALVVSSPRPAAAVINLTDDIELEGFLKLQNILRTPKFDDAEFIMQRNTAQLESKYYFLRESEAFHRFSTGRLEEATLTVIGRGIYDSVYDARDSLSEPSGALEFKVREAFVDLLLPPFTLRLGRQQVVWGETDNFRALDVINPLNLAWHWAREAWEDIRIPLWMARGIYDIGKIGPFEEAFVEGVWIPADFRRNKIDTHPRRPWGFYGAGLEETANSVVIGNQLFNLNQDIRDRKPSRKLSSGQGGARFKAVLGDVDLSLNYFYGFSADPGFKVRSAEVVGNTLNVAIDMVNPRSHVAGITANYSEERFTQSVFRLETTFTTGVPVAVEPDADQDQYDKVERTVVMLGMDRPTWIRWLNPSRTFFISTQFFWRRYLEHDGSFRGIPSVVPAEIDGIRVPGRYETINDDKIDRDEFVATLAASTSYGPAGRWQPQFVVAFDPRSTGGYNLLSLDYLWTNHVVFRAEQHIYWRMNGGDPGPWTLGDIWGPTDQSRHETVFSVIFQF